MLYMLTINGNQYGCYTTRANGQTCGRKEWRAKPT